MNVIVNAFAFHEDYGNSMQLNKNKSDREKLELYMKNIIVSLISAKKQNPMDEVLLATNCQPSDPFKFLLEQNGIVIKIIPFDDYVMPKKFSWALAFYKLKVLDYLSKEANYDKILLIDTDTYCASNIANIWAEADYGILLYPIGHNFSHEEREKIRRDYKKLYPDENYNLIHYGGELVCGKRKDIKIFMEYCRESYNRIVDSDYNVVDNIGDETILAIAALHYKLKYPITEAIAYLCRYWTEKRFYLASTNCVYNPVCIWHLPAEKDRGMIVMYNYFNKHGNFPAIKKAVRIFALPRAQRPFDYYSLMGRYLRKKSNRK